MTKGALYAFVAYNIIFASKPWYRLTTNLGVTLRKYLLFVPAYYFFTTLKMNGTSKFVHNNKDIMK